MATSCDGYLFPPVPEVVCLFKLDAGEYKQVILVAILLFVGFLGPTDLPLCEQNDGLDETDLMCHGFFMILWTYKFSTELAEHWLIHTVISTLLIHTVICVSIMEKMFSGTICTLLNLQR